MATTTNYGWTTPNDTDLVKDGAAAIRTLGSSIDTTVFNNASAAIAKTIVDAKGDIIAATASDTVSRLAVGANDTVLTADSTTATGLKWAAAAGGSAFSGASVGSSTDQTISSATYTALTWDTETFDVGGYHDNATNNSRITIPSGKAGYYGIYAWCQVDGNTSAARTIVIYKNGSSAQSSAIPASATFPTMQISGVLNLAVGDYIEIFVYQPSGSNQTFYKAGGAAGFNAYFLGA
jgi:hypothetical protein